MNIEKNDTLTFLFWANLSAFVVHLLDETLMGGGFVGFIQTHFWSGFELTDFFIANTVWLILIAISNILYDIFGNRLAFIPLAFLWERVFNAIFHIGSSLFLQVYSPGLVTGTLFFIILYLVFRYVVARKYLKWPSLILSSILAFIFETVFVSSMWWAH